MHTVNFLKHLLENYQVLIYFFIFLGLIIEGEFTLVSIGILLHLGALNFYLILLFIILGLSSKTILGYYIGNVIHNKWNHIKFLKHIEKRVGSVMPHFRQRPFWSIFISKFIMGINNIVIIFSGYQKIDLKRYLEAEFCSNIIWAPALLSIGYLFSFAAINVSREIWRFSFIILVLIILFITLDKLISWIYQIFEEFHENVK